MAEHEDNMAVALKRRRFTLDEYYRLSEVGILKPSDRVELIEGDIVEMSPIGSRHAGTVARIQDFFSTRVRNRAIVWVQNPLRIRVLTSEPEPDVMLLERRVDFFTSRHPDPHDVHLVIEVADSSLRYDQSVKIPLYARAGIVEAWLVDLDARRVVVYRDPSPDGYRAAHSPAPGERFTPLAFPDIPVTLADLLG